MNINKKKPSIVNGHWYRNPVIYDFFSRAEDPDNICFEIIKNRVEGINNPIDLATGTGRMLGPLKQLPFSGNLYGIDKSKRMCQFAKNYYDAKIIQSSIENVNTLNIKSNFIVSCFGFPSKIWNKEKAKRELKSVMSVLEPGGIFTTIGWNEKFNCELSEMWYRFVPDDIKANTFTKWQNIRVNKIHSPRNCGLTWLKKNIETYLKFSSLQESAFVMGNLFGSRAMEYIIKNNKTQWNMGLGITYDICKK